jgi:hypothetical protein
MQISEEQKIVPLTLIKMIIISLDLLSDEIVCPSFVQEDLTTAHVLLFSNFIVEHLSSDVSLTKGIHFCVFGDVKIDVVIYVYISSNAS